VERIEKRAVEMPRARSGRRWSSSSRTCPTATLRELTAEFLLDNCRLAAEARDAAPWGKSLPEEIYLNEVLPYGVISERREPWRHDLRARFLPAVQGATRPAQAAAILNQKVFAELGVRYSTDRPKADQSPLESIEAKKATCTGPLRPPHRGVSRGRGPGAFRRHASLGRSERQPLLG
jgi:hypothetical protein